LTEGYKQTLKINIRVNTKTGKAIDQYLDGMYVNPIKLITFDGIIAQIKYKTSEAKDTKYKT
jgi:hypothetical protein